MKMDGFLTNENHSYYKLGAQEKEKELLMKKIEIEMNPEEEE